MMQTKSYIDFIWRKDAMVEIPEKRKRKIQNLANKGCEVKELKDYTGGKKMMKFFEENASDSSSAKYFLTVDDFNPRAKKLYENLGYKCVGELTDFYKKGINCYLMILRGDFYDKRNERGRFATVWSDIC